MKGLYNPGSYRVPMTQSASLHGAVKARAAWYKPKGNGAPSLALSFEDADFNESTIWIDEDQFHSLRSQIGAALRVKRS